MAIKISDVRGNPRPAAPVDPRPLIWFDIDNCLYSKDVGIDEMMRDRISAYMERLGLPAEEAAHLRHRYYTEYGLAIRGLVRHHQVDPLDYDAQCDAALPLETVLKPSTEMQALLKDIDRSRFRVWALTNAYYNHATRVLSLLNLTEYFDGVVSCDYGAQEFSCKPEEAYFNAALAAGGQPDPLKVYFVDDSALNIKGAHSLKWGHCVLFDEHGDQREKLGGLEKLEMGEKEGKVSVVTSMDDLRKAWPEVFVKGPKAI
ncbi:pyrimidine 5-nucleotidase [Leucosporidium creatinivorum]|uniref:Pyrimidine 5-nucleotidase n=1 Tax=Leucosporidium creatinivorum TaxID=106004 RepID=A0A1Y2FHY1_9BASI|nr:pyrimidine 5-nucleotidase [Leucosporidium creatinivorum]